MEDECKFNISQHFFVFNLIEIFEYSKLQSAHTHIHTRTHSYRQQTLTKCMLKTTYKCSRKKISFRTKNVRVPECACMCVCVCLHENRTQMSFHPLLDSVHKVVCLSVSRSICRYVGGGTTFCGIANIVK